MGFDLPNVFEYRIKQAQNSFSHSFISYNLYLWKNLKKVLEKFNPEELEQRFEMGCFIKAYVDYLKSTL